MRLAALALISVSVFAQDSADLGVIERIKTEAFDHSKVMDHLYYLSDVYGPRLTGSPEFNQAADWALSRMKEIGLSNAHFEKWGPFGRSWSLKQSTLELIEPRYAQLSAVPLAWSAPTNGPVTGELILAPLRVSYNDGPKKLKADLDAYKAQWSGKLRGKIVMLNDPRVPAPQTNPQFRRYTAEELSNLALAPAPSIKSTLKKLEDLDWPQDAAQVQKFVSTFTPALMDQFYDFYDAAVAERAAFFAQEGAAGILTLDNRAHEGMVFAEAAGDFHSSKPLAPATFVVTAEQYDRVARLVEHQLPVRLRLSVQADFSNTDVDGENIVAEIPGGSKKDEIVMVGAHFDSWHSGTGATDNGAGSAVMLEVMRVLKTLNLKLDRTVRIALWSGEEQGLYGSRAYVKQHFADPRTMRTTAEHAKLSGYFNLDNGSGKIRGVYLQGNDAMRPIFEAWLAPFRDQGVTTVTIRDTGGTDHESFAAVGLPGFQFIQDPLDYSTITHHSDMDTYDHAIPEDLMQASAVIAAVVYEAANREKMLPRRELPKPQ